MAENLSKPVHPLEARRPAFDALSVELSDDLIVEIEPDVAAVDLRIPPRGSGLRAAADVLGRGLPSSPGAWTKVSDGQAFRLGPDEWLVTSTTADPTAWEATLIDALRPHRGTATDVSAQRTGVRLRGARVRDLLAFGCSLDLRPRAFPAGSCAQTLLGQVGVLLAAHSSGDLQLFVRASNACYLADWLLDAAQELRPDPACPLLP